MTTATAQIANHLNIVESLITEVQEWAHVLFVRFTAGRPRFVSKKVLSKMEVTTEQKFKELPKIPASVERAIAMAEKAKAEWADKPERIEAYRNKLRKLRASGVSQLKTATRPERELIQNGIQAIDGYLGE